MALNSFYQDLTVTGSLLGIDLGKPSFSVKARSGDVFEALGGDPLVAVLAEPDGRPLVGSVVRPPA